MPIRYDIRVGAGIPQASAVTDSAGSTDTTVVTPTVGGGGAAWDDVITHGDQLQVGHVGPWSIQGVAKGSETLESLTGPGRGYWTFALPDEFVPTGTYVYNNSTSNHGGVIPGGGMTIDGYAVAAGTYVVQFRNFPDGYDFYARDTSKFLFRGCRIRFSNGVGGAGLFNDSTASASQQVMMHFCDVGLQSMDPPNGSECLMHAKFIGGANHRILRNYMTRSAAMLQPNAPGVRVVETWIDEYIFGYGESGTSGGFDSSVLHLNGISTEGGLSDAKFLRNHILCPSPDGSTGSTGSNAGQIGYGTQSGQTGHGAGSNPGRLTTQTDCIAVFTTNGQSNTNVEIADNYLGGSGVCLYAGNANGGATGIVVTGNTITTKWWTNGGNFGAVNDLPAWGSNGNSQSNNTWADDYGTGGNGCTALAGRQYPAGDGPRVGASWI